MEGVRWTFPWWSTCWWKGSLERCTVNVDERIGTLWSTWCCVLHWIVCSLTWYQSIVIYEHDLWKWYIAYNRPSRVAISALYCGIGCVCRYTLLMPGVRFVFPWWTSMETTPSSAVVTLPLLAFSFAIASCSSPLVRSSDKLAFSMWSSLPTSASRETTPLLRSWLWADQGCWHPPLFLARWFSPCVWTSLACYMHGVGGGTLLLLSHLLRKVSEISIQPLASPMDLISSCSASPLLGPLVLRLRSWSPVYVCDTLPMHRSRSGRRMHGYFAASPLLLCAGLLSSLLVGS